MGRLQICAAASLLLIASPFGAAAQSGVGEIGAPMAKPPAGAAKSSRTLAAPALGTGLGRYARALDAMTPEPQAATRGAKDVQVYQQAAPSVVLIISEDGIGSGALISADGKIVTNQHVVGEDEEVGVIFKPAGEGTQVTGADIRPAKVIRRDAVSDLAIVQVAEVPPTVKPLKIGGAAGVEVGADVHAIGHPTGQVWTYTRGIVSQIRRDFSWEGYGDVEHKAAAIIQTQTPINPGNSGGPLLNDDLEVVGVNSFSSEGEGLNFAVSGDDVKALLAATADRMPAKSTPRKNKASTACKLQTLEEWAATDGPKGTNYLVDADCDGQGDFIVFEPKSRREAIRYMFDENGDGEIDAVIVDVDQDGEFDFGLYDTDHDGKPDLKGEFKPGADEPYRYEKIEG
ncbi:S1C family serine protease [Phenylobacterium sp.]|uniref:S1C family serine protease n=1 Tax=Phenylobacterium sp. TaxID=1871053 RepID=UPI0035B0ADBA